MGHETRIQRVDHRLVSFDLPPSEEAFGLFSTHLQLFSGIERLYSHNVQDVNGQIVMTGLQDEFLRDGILAVHCLIAEAFDEGIHRLSVFLFLIEECHDRHFGVIIEEMSEEHALQVLPTVDASGFEAAVPIEGGPAKGANK